MGKMIGVVAVLLLIFSMTFLPAVWRMGYQIDEALSIAFDGLVISIIGAAVVIIGICVLCWMNGFYVWSEEKRKKKYGIK